MERMAKKTVLSLGLGLDVAKIVLVTSLETDRRKCTEKREGEENNENNVYQDW